MTEEMEKTFNRLQSEIDAKKIECNSGKCSCGEYYATIAGLLTGHLDKFYGKTLDISLTV